MKKGSSQPWLLSRILRELSERAARPNMLERSQVSNAALCANLYTGEKVLVALERNCKHAQNLPPSKGGYGLRGDDVWPAARFDRFQVRPIDRPKLVSE